MRYALTIFIVCLIVFGVKSQNQSQYNHYIANQGLLNPAYNGTRDVISGIIVHRSQWAGMSGAPTNEALNIHGPIEDTNLGVGLILANDHLGFNNTFDFMGAGSYKIQINRKQFVSLGLQMGLSSIVYDGTKAELDQPDDPAFPGKITEINFNVGVGGYLFSDDYFAGISIPKFFSNSVKDGTQGYKNTLNFKNLHTYIYGGYVFDWGNVKVKPTLLTRFVYGAPLEFDVSGNVLLMEKLWLGLSYRSVSDVVFLSEYVINRQFTVRYSFDYSISPLNTYARFGSHELSLQFDFNFVQRAGMRSIRYF